MRSIESEINVQNALLSARALQNKADERAQEAAKVEEVQVGFQKGFTDLGNIMIIE